VVGAGMCTIGSRVFVCEMVVGKAHAGSMVCCHQTPLPAVPLEPYHSSLLPAELQPPRTVRPKTTTAVARRLIGAALGTSAVRVGVYDSGGGKGDREGAAAAAVVVPHGHSTA
jgi:hypothetical protein